MSAAIGISAFRRGFALTKAPATRAYVLGPVLTSLVVVCALLFVGYSYIRDAVAWVMGFIPSWLAFIEVILAPLFYVVGVLAGGWLFGLVATIVASPFLGLLSARAEACEFGDGPTFEEGIPSAIASTLKRELRKLAYALPRLLLVLLVSIALSPIAPLIWYAFGAWIAALEFIDFAPENRGAPLQDTLDFMRSNRAPVLVFGGLTAFFLAIPIVNVFVIPAAVCGGAVLWRTLTKAT